MKKIFFLFLTTFTIASAITAGATSMFIISFIRGGVDPIPVAVVNGFAAGVMFLFAPFTHYFGTTLYGRFWYDKPVRTLFKH